MGKHNGNPDQVCEKYMSILLYTIIIVSVVCQLRTYYTKYQLLNRPTILIIVIVEAVSLSL